MELSLPTLSRRAFSALAAAVLSAPAIGDASETRLEQFVEDLIRSYESQYTALDMEDVNMAFRVLQEPVLGVGVAAGSDRATVAANAAVRSARVQAGQNALVVVAFPTGDWRLREFSEVINSFRPLFGASGMMIFGLCVDERLARGSARVSVLAG